MIKSTAIDPAAVDADGVYRKEGPGASVHVAKPTRSPRSRAATAAPIRPGDVIVLAGRGPLGSGMEETYQITAALHIWAGARDVAVMTDARFSGVSTGACIGHVSPEALAGGPIGKIQEGDRIRIVVDRNRLEGSVDLVGDRERKFDAAEAQRILASRESRPDLQPDPRLPADTRLWAALQSISGGPWGGCVYDVDAILKAIAERLRYPL